MSSSLHAHDLSFSFSAAVPLLARATFHLPAGWTGVAGENGAGKTTLLRLLAGELRPSAGTLRLEPEGAQVHLCAQAVEALEPHIEALLYSPEPWVHRLLGRLGLEHDQVLRWPTLSPGERKRWQLAAALGTAPSVLLLDEPTNHLDAEGRRWLLEALRGFEGVGLLVSHDRALLDALTVRTLRLHRGGAALHPGGYGKARALWEEEQAAAVREKQARKAEAQRTLRKLDQKRREVSSAMSQRSAGARMKDKNDSDARSLMADFSAARAEAHLSAQAKALHTAVERARASLDEVRLEKEVGRGLFLDFERPPLPWLVRLEVGGAQLSVSREDRIRVTGPNGAGKTTLLSRLRGACQLPEERLLWLPQELSQAEQVDVLRSVKALPNEDKGRVLSLLAALGVDPERVLRSLKPSHGEARKLLIARGLGLRAWLAVLDEPTNHLDLPSIERLQAALEQWPGALLLVSHDRALAEAVTAREWRVSGAPAALAVEEA